MAGPDDPAPPDWLLAQKARADRRDRPVAKPVGRWLGDFLDQSTDSGLLEAEEALLLACGRGRGWDGSGLPAARTQMRAGFVRFLAMGGDETAPVHEAGVQITGAQIQEDIDLRGARCVGRLILIDCVIEGLLQLEDGHLGVLMLNGSRVRGVLANRAVFEGSVFLQNGFHATGAVTLFGATIGGSLQATGGRFEASAPATDALVCTGAVIRGNVILNGGFRAKGTVWLNRAQIGGDMECGGARFACRSGRALNANGATIAGSLRLKGARVVGGVGVRSARIEGDLDATDASLRGVAIDGGGRDWALDAASIRVGRSLILGGSVAGVRWASRFKALGGVALALADIGETLSAAGGLVSRIDGAALDLSTAHVRGSVNLIQAVGGGITGSRFEARGAVSLYGARIDGHLNCEGGLFVGAAGPDGSPGPAIYGEILQVGGCVFLTGPESDAGPATPITSATPTGAPFESHGEVMLHAARVAMQVSCLGGTMVNTAPDPRRPGAAAFALNLAIADIGFQLLLGPAKDDLRGAACIQGSINLAGAVVHGGLYDRVFVGPKGPSPEWCPSEVRRPGGEALRCDILLDDFTYGLLDSDGEFGLDARRAWLMRQPQAHTGGQLLSQPFEHLAAALDAMGHGGAARDIRILKEEKTTRGAPPGDKAIALVLLGLVAALLWTGHVWQALAAILAVMAAAALGRHGARSAEWLWRRIFGWVVSYGYRPGRGLAVALVVALVGGAFYQQAERSHALARAAEKSPASGASAAPFHPYVYSLDVMLPVAKLGEAEAWKPTGKPFVLHGPFGVGSFTVPAVDVQKIVWLETAFGWLAGGILVAMVSGLVKKRAEGD